MRGLRILGTAKMRNWIERNAGVPTTPDPGLRFARPYSVQICPCNAHRQAEYGINRYLSSFKQPMKHFFPLLMCVFICIGGCRKDPAVEAFYAGCTTDMRIHHFDTLIDGYDQFAEYKVDVDDDKADDIKLSIAPNPNGPQISIQTVGNLSFASSTVADTIFHDSLFHNYEQSSTGYDAYAYVYTLCDRITDASTVQSVMLREKPTLFRQYESNVSGKYVKGQFLLSSSYTHTEIPVQISPDSILHKVYITYDNDCSLKAYGRFYLIFKSVKGSSVKLGWIHFDVLWWSGLLLYETAIQQ
jgi:hypothetical protein